MVLERYCFFGLVLVIYIFFFSFMGLVGIVGGSQLSVSCSFLGGFRF